jgi:hypothetical protein
MGDSVTVSIKGEKELVAEFDAAIKELPPKAKKIVSKGALNVKADTRRRWRGIAHAPRLPLSVSYDLTESAGEVSAEIGPVDGPALQGFLGAIIEFGGIHSGPNPGLLPSLAAEEPKFAAQCDALLAELLP